MKTIELLYKPRVEGHFDIIISPIVFRPEWPYDGFRKVQFEFPVTPSFKNDIVNSSEIIEAIAQRLKEDFIQALKEI